MKDLSVAVAIFCALALLFFVFDGNPSVFELSRKVVIQWLQAQVQP